MKDEPIRIKSILPDNCMRGYDNEFSPNEFFFKQDCFLKEYQFDGKEAGNIINEWSAKYNINQRIILVTLQREMSLISKSSVDQLKPYTRPNGQVLYPLDWCCGYGVPDDDIANAKYKGYENQIMGACSCYDHWFNVFKPDTPIEMNDKKIKVCIPETALTLALLEYTPHVDALTTSERLFESYFDGWLSSPV